MLGIGKLGVGQVDYYYLNTVARGVEDFYTGVGETPEEWMGSGAARLGLAGHVDPADLRAVLAGTDPATGTSLLVDPPRPCLPLTLPRPDRVLEFVRDGAQGIRGGADLFHGLRVGELSTAGDFQAWRSWPPPPWKILRAGRVSGLLQRGRGGLGCTRVSASGIPTVRRRRIGRANARDTRVRTAGLGGTIGRVTVEQLPAGVPGFRRASCLGCEKRVVAARDALITIVGRRDGSWISAFPIKPYLVHADPLPAPADVFVLGAAHRACLERAIEGLRAGRISLGGDLPVAAIDHPDEGEPKLADLTVPPDEQGCAFCDECCGSDEHIFARWISRVLGGNFVVRNEYGERPAGTIPLTTDRVCGGCNNDWLSVLENDCKPVLSDLLLGNDVELGETEQRQVSTWAYKTALMLDLAYAGVVQLGYHRQFEMERCAPDSALVWIGGYTGSQAISATVRPLQCGEPEEKPPLAVLTTFTVGRLLVQVFHHFTVGGVSFDDQRFGAPYVDQTWPTQPAFTWPRRRVGFNDREVADLIDGVVDKG